MKILYQWTEEIARHLPSLNSWQVANVALFSQSIMEAESCQQGRVARVASCGEAVQSTARRWRRFLANEHFPQAAFVAEWSRWVSEAMKATSVTLIVDETKLSDHMAAMVVGVAWQARCIPLSWRCYRANDSAAYPAEGQTQMIVGLLQQIRAGLPDELEVLVLADRGIGTSPTLCRAIDAMGWYYLFRVTRKSKICTETGEYTIAEMVQPGEVWAASGHIFKRRGQLPAFARARWTDGYAEPWALVTNDPACVGTEYALRNWEEQGFRDLKSYGWQWHTSQIRLPSHMERLLVLLTLAYAWVLALGAYTVSHLKPQPLIRRPDGTLRRHWSLFKEGLQCFTQFVQRKTVYLPLHFTPDKRFT